MWSSQTFVCVLLSLEVKYSQLFVTTATLWWQVTLSQTMLRPWKVSWNLPSMAKIYVALLHNTYRYLAAFFSAKKSSGFFCHKLLPVNFSPNVFVSVVHLDSPSRGESVIIFLYSSRKETYIMQTRDDKTSWKGYAISDWTVLCDSFITERILMKCVNRFPF